EVYSQRIWRLIVCGRWRGVQFPSSASLLSQFTFATTPHQFFGIRCGRIARISKVFSRSNRAKRRPDRKAIACKACSPRDSSGARCRSGASEDVEIFFSLLQVVDFETKVIQSGHQAAVSIHVPRSDHQEYFAVAQIKAVVAAETFHRLEFKGLLVEFGNGG